MGHIRSWEARFSGALHELVNVITSSVALPIGKLPDAPPGEIFEPVGSDARAGADLVDTIIRTLTVASAPLDPQLARASRPLLATVAAEIPVPAPTAVTAGATTAPGTGPGTVTTHLHFTATATGNDWGATDRESALVAVYVDGHYQSTVIVMEERSGGYTVNLGILPPGSHAIELRSANDVAGSKAAPAQVSDVSLQTVTGAQAEIDAHAPIIELRGPKIAHGSQPATSSSTDAPLVLVPVVTQLADGTRTIGYHVAFTNEDGGTLVPDLFARYGRGTDYECVYTVHLSVDGRVLDDQYQAPIHKWLPFDGVRENGRPVLRVSTANNMVSARVSPGSAERWSDAAIGPVAATVSDTQVMTANPWIWAVMGKELLREGKAVTTGEPGKRQRVGTGGDAEARDLGQAARDEAGLAVVAETELLGRTRRDGDDVL